MGLLYKPFGILLGILAGLVGKKTFDFVWTKIDDREPPEPTTEAGLVAPGAGRGRAPGRDLPHRPVSPSIATARSAGAISPGPGPARSVPTPTNDEAALGQVPSAFSKAGEVAREQEVDRPARGSLGS